MAKQVADTSQVLDDMLEHEQVPARRNLGNIPDELDPMPGQPPVRVEAPEPPPPPAPEAEPEPETPAPEPAPADETASRVAALERELLFLRASQAPVSAPPAAPEPPSLPFRVSPQDVETIRAGTVEQAAELLTGAMGLLYQRAVSDTEARIANQYMALQTQQQTNQTLDQKFAAEHPDLVGYPEILNAQAHAVRREYPNVPAHLLLGEVASRTRARLSALGVKPAAAVSAAKPTAARPRIKPARLEGGGGGGTRSGGRPTRSATDRILEDMWQHATGAQH